MNKLLLALFSILPGIVGVIVFGYFSLVDWAALEQTYLDFEALSQTSTDLAALFKAEAQQNIHRINLFAEGVWVLLSAILAAIGLHGLATIQRR